MAASAGASAATANGGAAGKLLAGQAGRPSASGGTPSGGAEGSGAAPNIFFVRVNLQEEGGPICLPRSLDTGLPGSANDGRASSLIAELEPGSCDCSQTARAPLSSQSLVAARGNLQSSGACGGGSGVACESFCGCEILQTPGLSSDQSSQLYACQNELTVAASVHGYCVIDQMRSDDSGMPAPLGNPAFTADCPAKEKRLLRFVGGGKPASGAILFLGATSAGL
jgi:hypothetical protein